MNQPSVPQKQWSSLAIQDAINFRSVCLSLCDREWRKHFRVRNNMFSILLLTELNILVGLTSNMSDLNHCCKYFYILVNIRNKLFVWQRCNNNNNIQPAFEEGQDGGNGRVLCLLYFADYFSLIISLNFRNMHPFINY